MKVCVVGGTGLLGGAGTAELLRRGHEVRVLSLGGGAGGKPGPEYVQGDYVSMDEASLGELLKGCEGLVFAAGVDERLERPAPVYDFFHRYNVEAMVRLLKAAAESGVRHCVVCGSYFAWFDRLWPQLRLAERHPYIRSRTEQEKAALGFAGPGFDVAVLEIPYVFGVQPGRRPVWMFLAQTLRAMRPAVFWPRGGTAMVTAAQVGQAIAGALETSRGGRCYPLGGENRTWKQLLGRFCAAMGQPDKKVLPLPRPVFALACRFLKRRQRARGIEGGLDLAFLPQIECRRLYIDPAEGSRPLGVQPDDLNAAIDASARLCADILDGRVKNVRDMRAE